MVLLGLLPGLLLFLLRTKAVQTLPVPAIGTSGAAPSLDQLAAVTVAAVAPPQDHFAAEQLAQWLSRLLPANISVVSLPNPAVERQPHILVGAEAAAKLLPPTVVAQLDGKSEAFACYSNWGQQISLQRGAPSMLALAGGAGQPRGTIVAVYEFLRMLGFRWWNAGVQQGLDAVITVPPPSTSNAPLPACARVYEPPIEYRLYNAYLVGAGDGLWRVQNHMSGAMDGELPPLPPEQGGGIGYVDGYFVSTLYSLVPPAEHFYTHPEWYSYGCIQGNCTRRHTWKPNGPLAKIGRGSGCSQAQLCLSNAQLRKFVVNATLTVIRELNDTNDGQRGTRPSVISVSQNDCSAGSRCQCPKCLAMEHAHGGRAGPFIVLSNEVATAVKQVYPEIEVDMLAYTFTEDPPNRTAPEPVAVGENLIARWAPIDIDFAYPLANQPGFGACKCRSSFSFSRVLSALSAFGFPPSILHCAKRIADSSHLAKDQLAGWAATTDRARGGKLYSWLYWNNYNDFLSKFCAVFRVVGIWASCSTMYVLLHASYFLSLSLSPSLSLSLSLCA